MMDKKFDELLKQLGTGPWNLLIILSASYWMLMVPYQAFGGVFLTPAINHTCKLPPEALVGEEDIYSTSNETHEDACWYRVRNDEGDVEEVPCTNWEFDNSTYISTLTSEFQLVCNRKYMRPTFQSIFFFAGLFGSPLNGFLADKYGRKTTIIVSSSVFTVLALSLSWIHNFTFIMVIRFIMGLMNPAAEHSNYTIAMEVCEPQHRAIVGIFIFIPWTLSMITWGGFGYMIRSWRWLQFTVALPTLIYMPMIWLADESPRWLIVRGHHDRAVKVLQKAARWNKATIPPEQELRTLMKAIQYEGSSKDDSPAQERNVTQLLKRAWASLTMLFRTRKIRSLTLAMYCMYLVVGTVYVGLSLGGDNFGTDPFMYMVLSGVMEIPGATLTVPLVQRFGRRLPNAICFFITGVSLLILPFIPTAVGWLSTGLVMIGKMTISAAYQIAFLLASEVFPTEVRLRGLGTASTIAVGGIAAAPYLVDILGSVYRWLPSVVFGIGGIVAGIVTFTVPEPLGRALPDTVAALEAGALSKKKKVGKYSYETLEENVTKDSLDEKSATAEPGAQPKKKKVGKYTYLNLEEKDSTHDAMHEIDSVLDSLAEKDSAIESWEDKDSTTDSLGEKISTSDSLEEKTPTLDSLAEGISAIDSVEENVSIIDYYENNVSPADSSEEKDSLI